MSGDVVTELTEEVMELFDVDRDKANRIIAFANKLALEKFDKWRKKIH